jgi:catechol 2,3-dioxygenase-like lactoylglutathione lyase family enzyme
MNINVSDIKRSSAFYGQVLSYLDYERADYGHEGRWLFEDWKRWLEGTPHEITIIESGKGLDHAHNRGSVGHHNHIAFCASDRADVDGLYHEVLVPLEKKGVCTIEDPPCDCPEYGEGYYATFFFDPDGLKYEFVHTPGYEQMRRDHVASGGDGS